MKFAAGLTRFQQPQSRGAWRRLAGVAAATLMLASTTWAQGWQPSKSVEFIVPAGTGGGADQTRARASRGHQAAR